MKCIYDTGASYYQLFGTLLTLVCKYKIVGNQKSKEVYMQR